MQSGIFFIFKNIALIGNEQVLLVANIF